jgi:hypothetical protein
LRMDVRDTDVGAFLSRSSGVGWVTPG